MSPPLPCRQAGDTVTWRQSSKVTLEFYFHCPGLPRPMLFAPFYWRFS